MAHSAPAAAAAAAAASAATSASSADAKRTSSSPSSNKPLLVKFVVFHMDWFGIFCEECLGRKGCSHVKEWTAGKSYIYKTSMCPTCKVESYGGFTVVADSEEVLVHPGIKGVLDTMMRNELRCRDCESKRAPSAPKPTPRAFLMLMPIGSAATTVARMATTKCRVPALFIDGKTDALLQFL